MLKSMLALSILISTAVPAVETVGEKVVASGKNAKRAVKKGAHRVSEALCVKSDLKCLADKAKNRAVESKDAVVDGSKELGNKVD